MTEILVPICSDAEAKWAANEVMSICRAERAHVHLLNVQRPLPRHVAQFFSSNDLREFHHDTGMRVLEPAIRVLDEAGVAHDDHVLVGHPAETIVQFAEQHRCGRIVVDSPSGGVLAMFGLGSIGSQVRHLMQAQSEPRSPAGEASTPS